MDLDVIILSERSQRKSNIIVYHLYIESKKKKCKGTYLQNRNRTTDIENKLTIPKGKEKGEIN